MPTLEKSHDKMSENFSKMTPAMRRHLTMHLSYLQSDCKKDALDDPLFHLNVRALNEFYQLNAFLYPSDVRTILDSCGTDKIRRALILLGQCQKPHILRQVDIEALRTEMEQVTGCGPAKQTLLDLVSRTNRTAVPFRVLLVGPSGIGKTTLLRVLLGLETPDSGTVNGDKFRWTAVFQENRLLEGLDAEGNLRFVLGANYNAAAAQALLEELGLGDVGKKKVRDYSGGMQRRLALARALLAPSDALALDEPFTGLDAENREAAMRAILRAAETKIVILSTHEELPIPVPCQIIEL